MISFNVTPKEIDFAGNPLAFVIESDNYIISNGSVASLRLTKTGTLTAGQSFIISFLDYELTFRVGSGDTDDGLYIPAAATIYEIAAYLKFNYLLTKYYDITTYSTDQVRVTAKEVGAVYEITADVTACAAVTKYEVAGTNRSVQPNFKILWQLFYKSKLMIAFESISEQITDVDDDGLSIIQINKILKSCLQSFTIELPEFNTQFLKKNRKVLFSYYLKAAEYYGTTPAVKRLFDSDTLYALKGKLPFDKFPGHDFIAQLISTKKFLTNQSQPIETYTSAQQFLTFINNEYRSTLRIVVEIYRTTAPTTPVILIKDWLYTIEDKDVIIVPSGYDQLSLSSYTGIFKYKVYLAVNLLPPFNGVSQQIEYKLIPKPLFGKQLLYQNDYGTYETLIVQKVQNKFEIETQVYEKSLEYNYQLPNGEMTVITENAFNKYTVRTGTMTKAAADNLCELLSNNEVYIIGKLQFVPIIIEKGTTELSDEADDLFTVKLEYRYTINGKLSEDA